MKQTVTFSDLSEDPADTNVLLRLDALAATIDLTNAEADELREILAPYFEAGQEVKVRATGGSSNSNAGGNGEPARIRAWARENGYTVTDRGRISADVREAYEAAQAGEPVSA